MKTFISTIFKLLIVAGIVLTLFAGYSIFFRTSLHYVDIKAPEISYNQYPDGTWTGRGISGKYCKLSIGYPKEHRKSGKPGLQGAIIIVSGKEESIDFKFNSLDITDGEKSLIKSIKASPDRTRGLLDAEDVVGKTYSDNGLIPSFSIYTSIVPPIDKIYFNFELEVFSESGESEIIKESIPLKKSSYKLPVSEVILGD